MSSNTAHPASATPGNAAPSKVCILLACFRGVRGAAKARRNFDRQINAAGGGVLDEVILRVDSRHRARVYDPRRVLAGTLTSALTWGVFGLLTGGVASGGLWAIIGAVCGGLFAYYTEHNAWEEPLASEPRGVYQHDDGRPMLGRKLKGKSQRELAMLGLSTPGQDQGPAQ